MKHDVHCHTVALTSQPAVTKHLRKPQILYFPYTGIDALDLKPRLKAQKQPIDVPFIIVGNSRQS